MLKDLLFSTQEPKGFVRPGPFDQVFCRMQYTYRTWKLSRTGTTPAISARSLLKTHTDSAKKATRPVVLAFHPHFLGPLGASYLYAL